MNEWTIYIREMALTGKPPVSGGRSNKLGVISFDSLVFIPAQLAKRPVDYFREDISAETIIGKNCNKPMELKTPIMIAAMSFGAVNKRTKIALAKASTIAGTATNTGEGGMLPEERKHARLLIAQYCYDEETEILTKGGWKFFKDLKKSDLVATLNQKTFKLEFQKPKRIIVSPYSGNLCHIKIQQVDLLVTPNHKLFIKRPWKEKFELETVENLVGTSVVKFKKDFIWNGKNKNSFKLPLVKFGKYTPYKKNVKSLPVKPFLKLLGYYISEGWCRCDKGSYSVLIPQNKDSKVYKKIKGVLNILPFKYTEINRRGNVVFRIFNKQLFHYFSKLGKSQYRYIPSEIKELSKNLLNEIFEALIDGDGNRRNGKPKYYYTVSKRLADDVQEIALKLGYTANIKRDKEGYRVNLGFSRKITGMSKFKFNLIPYVGKVYCCEVPNHIIFVRRNGKPVWCGNSTGRFGVDEDYIRKADAIEIKIGQGAKPGQGGLLPGYKVTKEIARIRKVPVGQTIHSLPYHPDIKNIQDLKKKVEWLRGLNDGPIIIKLGAGDVENDVKLAIKANPDVIAVDGMEGGTAAAPRVMLDDFGIPTLAALVKARRILDELKAKQELLIGGGLNKGSDVAKALALGANAAFMAFPMLIAMGCVYCQKCHLGRCPAGITSQDPRLRKKLNIEDASRKVVNFLQACTEEVKMATAACGKKDAHDLNRNDLRSLNLTVSKITGIPLV
ncbi:MAG: glutamate synthase-related protein [Candidatus Aenigmarchaeota archaeon]|nr:glutamate synthase-related protein [Candidatus Aenigmarchaeota archaeon]